MLAVISAPKALLAFFCLLAAPDPGLRPVNHDGIAPIVFTGPYRDAMLVPAADGPQKPDFAPALSPKG